MVLYRFEAKSFWIWGEFYVAAAPGRSAPKGRSGQNLSLFKWYNMEFGQFGLLELFSERCEPVARRRVEQRAEFCYSGHAVFVSRR
jgi:hypothetical protein